MKVYPVVHIHNPEQALEQTQIAVDAQADGVFLIHHGAAASQYDGDALIDSFNKVTSENPTLFVGMNYLGYSPLQGYAYTQDLLDRGVIQRAPDALWFDDATDYAKTFGGAMKGLRRLAEYREDHPGLKKIAFMGGVSFKYTEWYTADPAESARMAEQLAPFVDVVTTSGAGTGSPPSAEKITAMGRAAGPGRLAVASGISIENIADYSDQPDMTVLVASSLETEKYSGIFIPERVRAVVEAAHAISQ